MLDGGTFPSIYQEKTTMFQKLKQISPATHRILKLSVLSIAISSLVGCDEDFKDCQGFWDNAIGRTECSVTANSQPAQQALSADVKKAFGADPNKEDTDGDGLSDTFEITKGYPYLKPDNKDTDGNGVEDAKDDTDKDGLTNLEEMQANTSPINPDTDGDGLNDKSEIQTYKTNPLVADTDKDTIIDGREIANGSDPLIADADKFVTSSDSHTLFNEDGTTQKLTVAIAGKGDLASKVEVKGWSDFKTPFQVGKSYDISLNDADKSKMQDATITLPYDPNDPAAANPSDLKIYTISPTTGFYEELPTTVDTINHTITAKTTHFSPYFIGNTLNYFSFVKTIPQTCPLIGDPNAIPVDVALVIDSSGSMTSNDPQNLRIAAAKSFITNMKASDRAAVIDFDSGVIVRQNLTGEKTALSNALNLIDAAGGTNIGAGVGSAYSVLTTQSDASHTRVVILLTDGEGSYDTNLSNQLKAQNIRVFTIGLTGQVDEALLKAISSVTNGAYKQINDASGLVGVFGQFATVFGDTGADADKDGLTDCQEIQGITIPAPMFFGGQSLLTDPSNPDTDNDGLLDGTELGEIRSTTLSDGRSIYVADNGYTIYSNPKTIDTDYDGISDGDEDIYDTSPTSKDTDYDGLTDYKEITVYQTDPTDSDSDGDKVTDGLEIQQGTDPSVFNIFNGTPLDQFKKGLFQGYQWAKGGSIGVLCGDVACDLNTVPEIIGAVAGGFIPIFPDGRDGIAGIVKSDYEASVLAAAGLIPAAGDIAKGTAVVLKALAKHPELVKPVTKELNKIGDFGQQIAKNIQAVKSSHWSLGPVDRGRFLEDLAIKKYSDIFKFDAENGDTLTSNFRVIDYWDKRNGIAISHKSIDLDLASYATPEKFSRKINGFLKKLDEFPIGQQIGTSKEGRSVTITAGVVKRKELFLSIPYDLTAAQKEIIADLSKARNMTIHYRVD